ncbi:uncharacterized protein LAESUDRAFT_712985 [Laetiporus sulphureus 93-53]|uniref:Uncharacterized protein n=1 Tax=Laetiporus sulphureus 93-53 TaxID=1314785 RepID=A0A165F6J0_9APHY|nr:uncharacterized protein LAESUDRAFT_712985 [Laetiporus sulphureus 93-53]KZT08490.1 hypothetical protein LAESUDRAFT_712985 [Laetiporus sulphureus 93-53]
MAPTANDCKLSPIGLKSLKLPTGKKAEEARYQPQLEAAKMAFLVAGMHKDNKHAVEHDGFHTLWHVSRENLSGESGLREWCRFYNAFLSLVLDMLTALDRFTGGTTVMAHIAGQPDNLDNDSDIISPHVYFSPALCDAVPTFRAAHHTAPTDTRILSSSSHVVLSIRGEREGEEELYWEPVEVDSCAPGCVGMNEHAIQQSTPSERLRQLRNEVERLKNEIRAREQEIGRLYKDMVAGTGGAGAHVSPSVHGGSVGFADVTPQTIDHGLPDEQLSSRVTTGSLSSPVLSPISSISSMSSLPLTDCLTPVVSQAPSPMTTPVLNSGRTEESSYGTIHVPELVMPSIQSDSPVAAHLSRASSPTTESPSLAIPSIQDRNLPISNFTSGYKHGSRTLSRKTTDSPTLAIPSKRIQIPLVPNSSSSREPLSTYPFHADNEWSPLVTPTQTEIPTVAGMIKAFGPATTTRSNTHAEVLLAPLRVYRGSSTGTDVQQTTGKMVTEIPTPGDGYSLPANQLNCPESWPFGVGYVPTQASGNVGLSLQYRGSGCGLPYVKSDERGHNLTVVPAVFGMPLGLDVCKRARRKGPLQGRARREHADDMDHGGLVYAASCCGKIFGYSMKPVHGQQQETIAEIPSEELYAMPASIHGHPSSSVAHAANEVNTEDVVYEPEERECYATAPSHVNDASAQQDFGQVSLIFERIAGRLGIPFEEVVARFDVFRLDKRAEHDAFQLYKAYYNMHTEEESKRVPLATDGDISHDAEHVYKCWQAFKNANPSQWPSILVFKSRIPDERLSNDAASERRRVLEYFMRQLRSTLDALAESYGFHSVLIVSGNDIVRDDGIGMAYESSESEGFLCKLTRSSTDEVIGHLKAHVWNNHSTAQIAKSPPLNYERPSIHDETQSAEAQTLSFHPDGAVRLSDGSTTDKLLVMSKDIEDAFARLFRSNGITPRFEGMNCLLDTLFKSGLTCFNWPQNVPWNTFCGHNGGLRGLDVVQLQQLYSALTEASTDCRIYISKNPYPGMAIHTVPFNGSVHPVITDSRDVNPHGRLVLQGVTPKQENTSCLKLYMTRNGDDDPTFTSNKGSEPPKDEPQSLCPPRRAPKREAQVEQGGPLNVDKSFPIEVAGWSLGERGSLVSSKPRQSEANLSKHGQRTEIQVISSSPAFIRPSAGIKQYPSLKTQQPSEESINVQGIELADESGLSQGARADVHSHQEDARSRRMTPSPVTSGSTRDAGPARGEPAQSVHGASESHRMPPGMDRQGSGSWRMVAVPQMHDVSAATSAAARVPQEFLEMMATQYLKFQQQKINSLTARDAAPHHESSIANALGEGFDVGHGDFTLNLSQGYAGIDDEMSLYINDDLLMDNAGVNE